MKWSSQQRFRNKRRKSFPGWLMHVWSIYGLSGVSSRDLPFFITERKAKWRKNNAPLISLYCFVINCNTLLVSHLWVFAVFDGFENWFSQCSNSLRLPLTLTWETSSKAVHRDQFISDERPHLWLAKKTFVTTIKCHKHTAPRHKSPNLCIEYSARGGMDVNEWN